jgi:hypothetical protein
VASGKTVSWLLASVLAVAGPAIAATADDLRCAAVRPGEKIKFQGRPLLETPDIEEPELRLINALITERCWDQSVELMDQFTRAHPDNYHVFFVKTRLHWITRSQADGRVIAEAALRAHPDFSSMKILLASMDIDNQSLPDATRLLDEVEKVQPEDLWLFMDRLRIEAAVAATTDTAKTLKAVMADPDFPRSARAQAMHIAQYELNGVSPELRQDLFANGMDSGAGRDCELASMANELIELNGDPAGGAALIEKYLHESGACMATATVRALLAEAYLLEAAKIAPQPTRGNAKLIRQAKETLGGDLMPVAQRIAPRAYLTPIIPFLKGSMDVREPDGDGNTLICSAVTYMNAAMVKAQLSEGADPNGECENESLVGRLLLVATTKRIPDRQLILRSLLERGARVEGLKSCADPGNGDCHEVFYPILKEFDDRRAQTREAL